MAARPAPVAADPVADAIRAFETAVGANPMATLLQDTNGSAVYSNEKALFGYLPSDLYLALPATVVTDVCAREATPNVPRKRIDLKDLGKVNGLENYLSVGADTYKNDVPYLAYNNGLNTLRIAAMNFYNLVSARTTADFTISDETAVLISLLRARWVALGCLHTIDPAVIKDGTREHSEVVSVSSRAGGTAIERIAAAGSIADIYTALGATASVFAAHFNSDLYGMNMAVRIAEAVWCVSEYLFRTRGHHFKEAFTQPIIKALKAAFEGDLPLPLNAEWNHIFHTAIHPFGVRALPIMSAHFMIYGKVGNGLMLRMGSAPNGVAAITTSKAVIDVIATESWYPMFAMNFTDQLTLCNKMADAILNDKYAYSLAATLYGLERKTMVTVDGIAYSIESGKSHVSGIATVGQGLINALAAQKDAGVIEGFSFENAQALAKLARTNPLLAAKVSTMVALSLELLAQAKTLDQASAMVFPSVAPKAAA